MVHVCFKVATPTNALLWHALPCNGFHHRICAAVVQHSKGGDGWVDFQLTPPYVSLVQPPNRKHACSKVLNLTEDSQQPKVKCRKFEPFCIQVMQTFRVLIIHIKVFLLCRCSLCRWYFRPLGQWPCYESPVGAYWFQHILPYPAVFEFVKDFCNLR